MAVVITCDRCGALSTEDKKVVQLKLVSQSKESVQANTGNTIAYRDMCPVCVAVIRQFFLEDAKNLS